LTRTRRQIAAQRKNKEAGSQVSEPGFVLVGVLRRPHGLRGELQMTIETDFPERLQVGTKLFLGENHTPVTVRSQRTANDGLLLAFQEFPDRDSIESLRNAPLFTRAEDSPALPAGKYYQHQLIGLDVYSDQDQWLGNLAQILDTGANDIYVVKAANDKEILLPAISDVIKTIDIENKRIIVHLMEGLIPPL
jgi:16S rRNA processing protein RimM